MICIRKEKKHPNTNKLVAFSAVILNENKWIRITGDIKKTIFANINEYFLLRSKNRLLLIKIKL